jgi:beta-lactamase class A
VTNGRPSRPYGSPANGPLLLFARLIVIGAGLGVIAGTGLKLLAPRLAQGSVGVQGLDPAPKLRAQA